MSKVVWLLVEWVNKHKSHSKYSAVNLNSVIGNEQDIRKGSLIFVHDRYANRSGRAKILRMADKRVVREQKLLLEQREQLKKVTSMYMKCIRHIKNGSRPNLVERNREPIPGPSDAGALPDTDSTSDSIRDDLCYDITQRRGSNINRFSKFNKRKRDDFLMSDNHQFFEQRMHYNQHSIYCSSPLPLNQAKVSQFDKLNMEQGIQSGIPNQLPVDMIKKMELLLRNVHEGVKNVFDYIDAYGLTDVATEENGNTEVSESELYNTTRNEATPDLPAVGTNCVAGPSVNNSNVDVMDNDIGNTSRVRRVSAHTTNAGDDMMPIGNGNALVPARLLNEIDWKSYTTTTRQLLRALFPRRVLATHSLTGRPSPAFADKPVKKCLDPLLVNDIVNTVSERCNVPKRLVRSCITTKCTDESKLFRNRQRLRNSRQSVHRENISPPSTATDETSLNTS